jgi:hypothetical protein
MRKVLLALALVAPFVASADHGDGSISINPGSAVRARAIRQTQNAVRALDQLELEAQEVAHRAASNGNQVRARRFRELAQEARELGNELQREVLRPLRTGASLRVVSRNLDRLLPEINELNDAIEDINQLPNQISRLIAQVVIELRRLQSIL